MKFSKLGLKVIDKSVRTFWRLFNDKTAQEILFYCRLGYKLDFDNPKTMNEKLQWLKLNWRIPLQTRLVDKIEVKKWVAERIGEKYVIPTYAVWNNVEDIDVTNLPNSFVIKTNHSGGNKGVAVCPDKAQIDLKHIKKHMQKSLNTCLYKEYREWAYKNVVKKVFAEKYIGENPIDYKFYCFNGKVDSVLLCIGRETGKTRFYFFNRNWELCRYNKAGKAAPPDFTLPKPNGMDEMFDIASKLSSGFPFVRVDLYNENGNIYFGEMTLYPEAGFDANRLREADLYFGEKIDLHLIGHTPETI